LAVVAALVVEVAALEVVVEVAALEVEALEVVVVVVVVATAASGRGRRRRHSKESTRTVAGAAAGRHPRRVRRGRLLPCPVQQAAPAEVEAGAATVPAALYAVPVAAAVAVAARARWQRWQQPRREESGRGLPPALRGRRCRRR